MPGITASSAGTRAVIGHPIHEDAASVLAGLGGDAAGFAAQQLTASVALNADLILTMTAAHRDRVLELVPQRLNRTFLLAEASRLVSLHNAETIRELVEFRHRLAPAERQDIADPIGRTRAVFDSVGTQIAGLLPPILELGQRTIKAAAEQARG